MKPAATPRGLSAEGARLWRDVVRRYELRVDELRLLEGACRTVDTLARLEAALVDAPLLVAGSMGQQREHPLLAESRQQRVVLARLLAQLKLPEDEVMRAARDAERSTQARRAASVRWSTRGTA